MTPTAIAAQNDRTRPYDVEADFFLLSTCNFRCQYCFVPQEALAAKIHLYADNETWSNGFDATGQRWLIHISGGEPFVYPQFVDLCQRLTARHQISINSNLSQRSVEQFAETVDPQRVNFINAAIHYEERGKRNAASIEEFAHRAAMLQQHGFALFVSLVMTPPAFDLFPELQRQLSDFDLTIIPKVLRGMYGDHHLPADYTPQQRQLFRDYSNVARSAYQTTVAGMHEPPTIDLFSDDRMLDRVPSYLGQLCASGQKLARIEPDGRVMRCSSTVCLGNILERNVRLLVEPTLCDVSYCPYFCEKYTSPKFVNT